VSASDAEAPESSPPATETIIGRCLREACGTAQEVEVVIELADGRDVFIEGRRGASTLAASLQLGGDGGIQRRLLISCPLVGAPQPWESQPRPQLLPLFERYFEALNDARFADAAACFSEDCVYVHPPYRPGEPLAIFNGREELAAQWPARRGSGRVETRIERCVQSGNHAFVEGVAAGGSFLSSIVLATDGLISRYVAFYSPELVPRVADA
jgi:hypothetical protein